MVEDRVIWGDFRFAPTFMPIFKGGYENFLKQMEWIIDGEGGITQVPLLSEFSIKHVEGGPNVYLNERHSKQELDSTFMDIHTICFPEDNNLDSVKLNHIIEYNDYITATGTSTFHCYDMYQNTRTNIPKFITDKIEDHYNCLDDSILTKFMLNVQGE